MRRVNPFLLIDVYKRQHFQKVTDEQLREVEHLVNAKIRENIPLTEYRLSLIHILYNRKYWKLPIVYGGFVGCAYALTWNNRMYKDYSQAYLDIMDDDLSLIHI